MDAVTRWVAGGLLTGSVQGALLIALIWIASRTIPRMPASLQAALWWVVALKLIVALLPVPALPIPVLPAHVDSSALPSSRAAEMMIRADTVATVAGSIARLQSPRTAPRASSKTVDRWLTALVAIWFAGVSLLVVRLLAALSSLRGRVRRSTPSTVEDIALVAVLAPRLGLTNAPDVRISHEIDTPQLVGLGGSIVLMPAGSATLTGDERSMALAHELMHVRRHDLALGWVPALAGHLFFFHPLARLAVREYVTARESACDAAVVRALGIAPQDYGRLLVRAGVAGFASPFAAGGASDSTAALRRRLEMLQRVDTRVSRRSICAIAAVMIVAATPFRLVATTPVPRSAPAVAAIAAPSLSTGKDHFLPVRVSLAAAAEQAGDAAAVQRKALDEQRRKLDEVRRALEAREAEMRETLQQRLAEIESARAQIEEKQRNVNEQVMAVALAIAERRQRDANQSLAEQTTHLRSQQEQLERLVRSHRELLRQQQERAQEADLRAAAARQLAAAAAMREQRAQSESYSRGDIVVLALDSDGARPPNSRVLAVAGDRLRVAKTGIAVNGEPAGGLSPEFLAGLPEDPWKETVPAGHYFVAADVRSASGASRFWGLIPSARIAGRP